MNIRYRNILLLVKKHEEIADPVTRLKIFTENISVTLMAVGLAVFIVVVVRVISSD